MRFFRVILGFVMTLLLFWASPQLPILTEPPNFIDTAVDGYIIDHEVVNSSSTEIDPQISLWITTPKDTSEYKISLNYRSNENDPFLQKIIPQLANSYDLHATTLPRLSKGEQYYYYIELIDNSGNRLARMPQGEEQAIPLRFKGEPDIVILSVHIAILFLAAMFVFMAMLDAAALRTADYKIKKLSQKIVTATIFLIIGGLITGTSVIYSIHGYRYGGWPLGTDISQTLIVALIIYWSFLTFMFKKTLFRIEPGKKLISAGGATVLTLLGVFFMIVTYMAGQYF